MKRLFLLVLMMPILGCVSMEKKIDDYGSSWISRPLSELKEAMKRPDSYASKTDWDETTYPLSKGYYIFVEPFSKDCFIQWKINPSGRIVGYFAKGKGCGEVKANETDIELIDKFSPPAK